MSLLWQKFLCIFLLSVVSSSAFASIESIYRELSLDKGTARRYPLIANKLIDEDLYFTAVPFIKEFLTRHPGASNKSIDRVVDKIITRVGVRQFEVLPVKILKSSKAPTIRYILAKKFFRSGKYENAMKALRKGIPWKHPAKPFALALSGTINSMVKRYPQALSDFDDCIKTSKEYMKKDKSRSRHYRINRDNCIAGIARTQFADKKYEKAASSYLDIEKSSPIWPDILFEEAWNSFYLKGYNRTLGKLVTYKAPVFNYIFNPEVDVLRALTYLELCLYKDVKDTIEGYYKEYEKGALHIDKLLKKRGKNYKYYYLLAKARRKGTLRGGKLLNKIVKATIKDPAYEELYKSFMGSKGELAAVKAIENSRLKAALKESLRSSLILQRDLIGSYVRKRLRLFLKQMNRSFAGMSYISLEMNQARKRDLYGVEGDAKRSRGNIRNLKRTEKQYFWTFNGEFWADELGDYAFSLKSECK